MRLARVKRDDEIRWGQWHEAGVQIFEQPFVTTAEVLEAIRSDGPLPGDEVWPIESVEVLSPITQNQQVIAQATNFRSHIAEIGGNPEAKTSNAFFRKASSCLTGPDGPVLKPSRVHLLDYELELGLVIGRAITGPLEVSEATLADVVCGLVMHNDISAREHQIMDKQFHKAKSWRSFGPTGPYIKLLDQSLLARVPDLEFSLSVNGEQRQKARLGGDMIHEPAATLSELSGVMDLGVGDLVVTGTPAGVALRVPSKLVQMLALTVKPEKRLKMFIQGQLKTGRFLKPGDVIEASLRTPDGALDLGEMRTAVSAGV